MFENLSDRLERSFKILKGEGQITEINVAETLKDVRRALLDADVNFKVAKTFTDSVKQKAMGMNVLTAVKPGQLLVKVVHDELADLMGGDTAELKLEGRPAVILMSGLQGSGKTTFSGKLANLLKNKKNRKPLLVACDVYRPAAIAQLKVVGEQIGVPVYSEPDSKDVVAIAEGAVREAKAKGYDVVIVDTAGRLAVDEEMMTEISNLKNSLHPDETLFVVDSMTGQDAVNVAKSFNDSLDITGVIITKLDGDTRGGAALSIRSIIDRPIKFTGQGEKLDALEPFYPDRMSSRILGMGDMMTLIEKAQQEFDEARAQEMADKIKANSFDFNDFIEQMDQVNKMGPLKDLIKLIPGINKIPGLDELDVNQKDMARVKAIVLSMTPAERENPDIISQSRRKRIAAGCGQSLADVNRMIKQFNQSRDMMSQMSNGKMGGMKKMMAQLQQGGGGFPGMGGGGMSDTDFMTPEQLAKRKAEKDLQRKLKKLKKRR